MYVRAYVRTCASVCVYVYMYVYVCTRVRRFVPVRLHLYRAQRNRVMLCL